MCCIAGVFSFYSQPKSHGAATIIEFIEKAIEHSRSGRYLYFLRPRAPGLPPAPIQLLFPVSRFHQVASLQHLCRFLILKQVRRDHISLLPVPRRIVDYLEQTQYYTELAGNDSLDKHC
jgi:suppressor of cytokine signaling 7